MPYNILVINPGSTSDDIGYYRGETAVFPDINREGFANKAVALAREALERRAPAADLLEAAEFISNLLECGELVPMAHLPSAKVAAYRRQSSPDMQELRAWLYSLIKCLCEACQIS